MIGKPNFEAKKFIAAVVSIVACAMIAIGGYAFYNTPTNYVSLDINPSIELGINAFNRVVRIEGINEDGKELLTQKKLQICLWKTPLGH